MHAFVSGINDILRADANFFNHLYGRDITVVIKHSSKIIYEGQGGYAGLHSGVKGTNKSVITLAGDVFTGHTAYPDYPDANGETSSHKPYMIIAHEFSHAIHFALVGDNFFDYSFELKELFAITMTNRIQPFHGDPHRSTWSPIIPFHPFKSTWWHYQIHSK